MKNKTIGLVIILFFIWLFAENDKTPATESRVQNSKTSTSTSTSSSLSAAQRIPDITGSEQPEHRYVNADALKVRSSPKGNALDTLKRGTSVNVYEQRGTWSRISTAKEQERWIGSAYLCEMAGCYIKNDLSQSAPAVKQRPAERHSAPAKQPVRSPSYDSSCSCSSGNVCIGPRGGRYCITSGGNKRYGV
ncbi:SH3 domain-containing protein [Kluyvera ascorbata]